MNDRRSSSAGPIATSLLMAAMALVGSWRFRASRSRAAAGRFLTIQGHATLPAPVRRPWVATVAKPLERQFGQIAGSPR